MDQSVSSVDLPCRKINSYKPCGLSSSGQFSPFQSNIKYKLMAKLNSPQKPHIISQILSAIAFMIDLNVTSLSMD